MLGDSLSSSDLRDIGLRFLKRRSTRTPRSKGRRDAEPIVADIVEIFYPDRISASQGRHLSHDEVSDTEPLLTNHPRYRDFAPERPGVAFRARGVEC